MQVSSFIRDTLSLVQKEQVDQASDLANCFTYMFRPDFTNCILPASFYASLNADLLANAGIKSSSLGSLSSSSTAYGGGANAANGIVGDLDLISGCLLNPSYASLVGDSIAQKPVFMLFKELAATGNQSHEREMLVQMLSEAYVKQNRIGYFFLYYIYAQMLRLQLSTSANTSVNAVIKSSKGKLNFI